MTAEDIEELKKKARQMAEYYAWGFGNSFQTILWKAELYISEGNEDVIQGAYERFGRVTNLYEKIPFDALQGQEQFCPLFMIRHLLPKFKEHMDSVFHGKTQNLDEFTLLLQEIMDIGQYYFADLSETVEKIQLSGASDGFEIPVFHIEWEGKSWRFC